MVSFGPAPKDPHPSWVSKCWGWFPDSKAEVERITGMTVVSVEWVRDIEVWIKYARVWDGVTFLDQYFCGRPCATAFGYDQAKGGAASKDYADACDRQRAKAEAEQTKTRQRTAARQ